MKLMSIKRLVGLAAIYGAVQYARRHGGAKKAFDDLLGKAKGFANDLKQEAGSLGATQRGHVAEPGFPTGGVR